EGKRPGAGRAGLPNGHTNLPRCPAASPEQPLARPARGVPRNRCLSKTVFCTCGRFAVIHSPREMPERALGRSPEACSMETNAAFSPVPSRPAAPHQVPSGPVPPGGPQASAPPSQQPGGTQPPRAQSATGRGRPAPPGTIPPGPAPAVSSRSSTSPAPAGAPPGLAPPAHGPLEPAAPFAAAPRAVLPGQPRPAGFRPESVSPPRPVLSAVLRLRSAAFPGPAGPGQPPGDDYGPAAPATPARVDM